MLHEDVAQATEEARNPVWDGMAKFLQENHAATRESAHARKMGGAVSLTIALQTALTAISTFDPDRYVSPKTFTPLHLALWQLYACWEGARVTEIMHLHHSDLYLNLDELSHTPPDPLSTSSPEHPPSAWAEMWRDIIGQRHASGGYDTRTPWLTLVLLRCAVCLSWEWRG